MKKQYLVMAQQAWQVPENRWINVAAWNDIGKRYCSTEAEARELLRDYIATWNRDFKYGKDGKRVETQVCGMIGIDVVSRKEDDDRHRVVAWKIKVREVTEWEEVECG